MAGTVAAAGTAAAGMVVTAQDGVGAADAGVLGPGVVVGAPYDLIRIIISVPVSYYARVFRWLFVNRHYVACIPVRPRPGLSGRGSVRTRQSLNNPS